MSFQDMLPSLAVKRNYWPVVPNANGRVTHKKELLFSDGLHFRPRYEQRWTEKSKQKEDRHAEAVLVNCDEEAIAVAHGDKT